MAITFVLGSTTVSLPDPSPDYPVRDVLRQAVGRTAGGTVFVYQKGVQTYEAELSLAALSDTQKGDLTDFFADEAEGCRNTFTYTDPNSNAFTARFLDPTLEFVKAGSNVWDVILHLELSGMGG